MTSEQQQQIQQNPNKNGNPTSLDRETLIYKQAEAQFLSSRRHLEKIQSNEVLSLASFLDA